MLTLFADFRCCGGDQVEVVVMGAERPVKSASRGVVTFMSTSRPDDVRNLKKALAELSRNLLTRAPYPVRVRGAVCIESFIFRFCIWFSILFCGFQENLKVSNRDFSGAARCQEKRSFEILGICAGKKRAQNAIKSVGHLEKRLLY